ncbi:MAG: glycoside hydrolase family 3 N-terminal domain-containing protein, partial [Pseudomonadota bacterium]
ELASGDNDAIEARIRELLGQMTLAEKVGQTNQVFSDGPSVVDHLRHALAAGRVGSIINEVDVGLLNELQRIAVEESRLGIPLLFGRDVIHGFKTVLPIPLGQAATWNPDIVRRGARVAAAEAARSGVNWTFAPMIDVTRDPRWGRIAESLGEDPFLVSALAVAMVQGFQGDDLRAVGAIAATAKHFAGYGAVESGRDYATTNLSEYELRNYYLPPFEAAVNAGVCSLMTSFSDLNGVPATGNGFLLRDILREEWGFDGLVVSDWDSVRQLAIHGLTENDRESALAAALAGVDMEMVGESYSHHLPSLVEEGALEDETLDAMVANILRIKLRLGLFEQPYAEPYALPAFASTEALATAHEAALESVVLLKNDRDVLPLDADAVASVAVIGPLAEAPYEQLGTWIFDGDPELSVTPLKALERLLAERAGVRHVRAMDNSRSRESDAFDEADAVAADSDAVVLVLGEESILSGEAHSRADIDLPGDQVRLVERVRRACKPGTPVVAVILAGRPLTLTSIVDHVDAILYAWHPGTMGGAAIADLLFGRAAPSGKLPVTFPRMVGQIPIYFGQKNTGKPPSPETIVHIDDIDPQAPQTSLGMTAFHLDAGYTPLFAFGHGLSYTRFAYSAIRVSAAEIALGETLTISADLENVGERAGVEVAQLYVRDLVGSVTRPVRELKGFARLALKPGERTTVSFTLHTDDLSFVGRAMRRVTEPGRFLAWIGGSSEAELETEFRIVTPA